MIFTVDSNILLKSLRTVINAGPKGRDSHIKVLVANSQLHLYVDNIATTVTSAAIDVGGDGHGSFQPVDKTAFIKCIEGLAPGVTVSVRLDESAGEVQVSTEGTNTILPVNLEPPLYQRKGVPSSTGTFTFEKSDATALRTAVNYTAEDDPNRAMLSGVFISKRDGGWGGSQAVATDGHRLFYSPLSGRLEGDSLLLSREFLNTLFACPDESVKVEVDGENLYFTCSDFSVKGLVVDANFPNWQQVVPNPAGFQCGYRVPARLLQNTVKNILSTVDSRTKAIRLEWNDEADTLRIFAQNSDGGSASQTITQAETLHSGDSLISVNGGYVIEAMNFYKGKDVVVNFQFTNAMSPITINSDRTNRGAYIIVMPIRM